MLFAHECARADIWEGAKFISKFLSEIRKCRPRFREIYDLTFDVA